MKKCKAAGPYDITSEMITALNEIGIKELPNIIYDTGEILAGMKKSVYIAIPKNKALLRVINTAR